MTGVSNNRGNHMRERLAGALARARADYAEIRVEEVDSSGVSFRGDKLDEIGSSRTVGGIVRALARGGWGTSTFNDLDDLPAMVAEACESARLAGRGESSLAAVDPLVEEHGAVLEKDFREVSLSEKKAVAEEYNDIILRHHEKIETTNVNLDHRPADIIDDICAPSRLQYGKYDGVVCLSVLEHVYDPFAAMAQIHNLLQPGGYLLLHLPFLFRYHAPRDLTFTDGYRFSRDGIAWLLRDFSEVRLYSIRGPYSSIFNLHKFWKKHIERRFGMSPARWVDRIGLRLFRRPGSDLQVSGYYAWARK